MTTNRRNLFRAAVAAVAGAAAASRVRAQDRKLGIPGPYRGRVVSVAHPGSIVSGAYQEEPVRQMIRRGMTELTGAPAWQDAWRVFFQPGDVVLVKLNPVGAPHVISAPEVFRAIVEGLNAAGVKNQDIVAYDRYRREFLRAGFDKWLPDGVRWTAASGNVDQFQLDMDGYDANHYMEMMLTWPSQDANDPHNRRSYVAKAVTTDTNKVLNLCVLKHHQSAGVTLALKNMSHGMVNNVARSHQTSTNNACGAFIPAAVATPIIRERVVLNILDGIKGGYHGGPLGNKIGKYVWEHKTMYFATDPVALDHIGWKAIDAQRAEKGMKPVGEAAPDADSRFYRMQPEHIEIAGSLGLGEFNEKRIEWKKLNLG